MIGYSPLDTTITLGPTRATLVLRIAPVAYKLATVPVIARRNRGCVATGIPTESSNPELAAIFEQLRANVERYNILLDRYPFHYRRAETDIIETSGRYDSTSWADTAQYDSRVRRPYHPGSIVFEQPGVDGQKRLMMYLPTFADLGDSTFDAEHCFAYAGREKNEIRIDFRPAERILDSDVEGSIYLDDERYIVRRAVFRLTKPRHAAPYVVGLTLTTRFEEILPLVPMEAVTRTDEPLNPIRAKGVDPHTAGRAPTMYDLHPLITQRAVEVDSVLDHTFIADELATALTDTAQPAPAPPPQTIALNCAMPPSFETADIPIYGIIGGVSPGNPNNDRLTLGIRRQFKLPGNLTLPVYGYEFNSKVAPTLTGQVTFYLLRGRLTSIAVTATSLIPSVDTALVVAVRRADSLKAFVGVPHGQYTISLSSAKPDPDALSIDLAHVFVPVEPLARKAAIDFNAPAPLLPTGTGLFEFVVDERGRAMPKTLVTVRTSSPEFAAALGKALDKLRFDPALSGNCPIKQVIKQPFAAQIRVQEQ